ncbi:MAG TPA: hypothetical protein VGA95_07770 [Thermodesulfobacteriota bacterium]
MQSTGSANQSERQSSRQSYGQDAQQSRQSYGQDAQQSRQSYGQDAQQSRQNYADNYDDYHYHGGGGYGYGYGGAYAAGAVTGAVIGSTMTAAAFSAMSAPQTQVVVGGVTYYQVGSTWYQPMYQGGQVTYVVVQPPQ